MNRSVPCLSYPIFLGETSLIYIEVQKCFHGTKIADKGTLYIPRSITNYCLIHLVPQLEKRMKKARNKASWNLRIESMLQQIMQKREAAGKKDKNVELIQQIMQKRVAVFKKGINYSG